MPDGTHTPDTPDLHTLPAIRDLDAEVRTILSRNVTIASPDDYTTAAETLAWIKRATKTIEEKRVEITKPLNESLRAINAQAKEAAAPFLEAEKRIKSAMVVWDDHQEKLRREEQRRADEAARKEREKLERQAAAAAAKGKEEKAAELEAQASAVVAEFVAPPKPEVSGVSYRTQVKVEIIDPDKVPRNYCIPDEKKIRKVAQAMDGDIEIPGVRIWKERIVAARAAG